jgi:hypothetical protein
MRGLFICDDANGNLTASQDNPAAAPVAELYEGRNILRASAKLENTTAWGKTGYVIQQPVDDAERQSIR